MTDEGVRHCDEPLGHTACIHHLTGKDEQRYGQKRELVDSADELLRDDVQECPLLGQNEPKYRCCGQGNRDRNTDHHEEKKYYPES